MPYEYRCGQAMDFIVASTRMERTEAILSWGRAGGGSYCSASQTVMLCRCCAR